MAEARFITTSKCVSIVMRGGFANLICQANEALVGVKCCKENAPIVGTSLFIPWQCTVSALQILYSLKFVTTESRARIRDWENHLWREKVTHIKINRLIFHTGPNDVIV